MARIWRRLKEGMREHRHVVAGGAATAVFAIGAMWAMGGAIPATGQVATAADPITELYRQRAEDELMRPSERNLYRQLAGAEVTHVDQGVWYTLDTDELAARTPACEPVGWRGTLKVRMNGIELFDTHEEAGLTDEMLRFDINDSAEARDGKYGHVAYGVAKLNMSIENVDADFWVASDQYDSDACMLMSEWRLTPARQQSGVNYAARDEPGSWLAGEYSIGGYFTAGSPDAPHEHTRDDGTGGKETYTCSQPHIATGETKDVSVYYWVPLEDIEAARAGECAFSVHVGMLVDDEEQIGVCNNTIAFDIEH